MADRAFKRNIMHLFEDRVILHARIAIGATGAPTLDATKSPGITSVTRNGAGDYSIVLADKYGYLFKVDHTIEDTTDNFISNLQVDTGATDVAATIPLVQINLWGYADATADEARVAADPTSGAVLKLDIHLSNTAEVFR